MKTLRKLIFREIISAVGLVTFGFTGLFFFFDLVDELKWVGQGAVEKYQFINAFSFVALQIPSHVYELMPICVLIGTIYVLSRLAQNSEFTILRTSGLGPARALRHLLGLGFGFVVLTFLIGDYLSPFTARQAQLLKSRYLEQITVGATGAWLKEKQLLTQQAVNVASMNSKGELHEIRIYEFDMQGQLISFIHATEGAFSQVDDAWVLKHVQRDEFFRKPDSPTNMQRASYEEFRWPTSISQEMVSVALLRPERMKALDLFQYIRHLQANGQAAQRYEIEFWRKVFYPISCLVMMVLALPFAYLHFRSGSIATYSFIGVLVGVSFFLLNNVFGYVGNLQAWTPWLAAAAPGLIYSLLSLGVFSWLVLRH